MLGFIFCLVAIESVAGQCTPNQLPCNNGQCINREDWCDVTVHCEDTSDERYCNYFGEGIKRICRPRLHFRCLDKSCIPKSGRCDSVADCKDRSDEQDCALENSNLQLETRVQNDEPIDVEQNQITLSMNRASEWLLGQLGSDSGCGKDTPRAIVALSLASTVPLNQSIKDTMTKQLHILLNLELIKTGAKQNMDLSLLSLYINSLLATCEDVRNFQGFDLVGQLRSRVSQIKQNEFVPPSALLTLCMANQTVDNDLLALRRIYEDYRTQTGILDTQALLIMAMSCVTKIDRYKNRMQSYFQFALDDFKAKFSALEEYDHYKIAFAIQALNSVDDKKTLLADSMRLTSKQLDDGSFSDVLGTYLALPALAGKSLLDIKKIGCTASDNINGNFIKSQPLGHVSTVKYSLWMGKVGVPDSHTISISFTGNQSLYNIMQLAESRNSLLKFSFDDTENGKMVYSLAGIPNDVERDQRWETYVNRLDAPMVVNTKRNLTPYKGGIDELRPSNRSHIVFWLRQGKKN